MKYRTIYADPPWGCERGGWKDKERSGQTLPADVYEGYMRLAGERAGSG